MISRQGIVPAGAYLAGLGLVGAAAVLSLKKLGGTPDATIYLAAGGFVLLLAALFLFHHEILKPIRRLRSETGRFAGECLGEGESREPDSVEEIIEALERIGKEFADSRFRARELQATVNVFNAEKSRTEAILRSLPIPVLVTDRFDDVLQSNEVAGRLFGFDPDACRGKPVAEVVDFPRLVDLIKRTSAHKVKVPRRTMDVGFKRGDGERADLRISLSSVIDSDGEILGVVTIVQDITRDKQIDRMKSRFVANISHELKGPLSSIQAYVEMLIDGEAQDEETRQNFYSIVDSESRRLRSMIDDLLNLSRLEAGIVRFKKERVSIHKVLQSALEAIEPHASRKKQKVETEISPYLQPVEGDPAYLERVFTNLLSNATKCTPEGGSLKLEARLAGESIDVDVVDTGCGISREEQERIFDGFYRARGDRGGAAAKGTGLGLAIARKIVELHDGSIEVESEPGKGSRFRVSLPTAA